MATGTFACTNQIIDSVLHPVTASGQLLICTENGCESSKCLHQKHALFENRIGQYASTQVSNLYDQKAFQIKSYELNGYHQYNAIESLLTFI